MLRDITGEARNQGRGGQPEDDRDSKRRKVNDDHSERQSKRVGGTQGGTSCSAQPTSELMHAGNLELTEALGEGVSGIVYRGT